MKLQGTVAIITGGAGEIAGAVAATLAREGADLAIADLKDVREDVLRGLRELGHHAIAVHCDITDQNSVDSMVAQTGGEPPRHLAFVITLSQSHHLSVSLLQG